MGEGPHAMPDSTHLQSLRDALGGQFTVSRLHDWVNSDERAGVLRGMAVGSITWSKELGRPPGPTLSAGFVLTHDQWHVDNPVATGEGIHVDKGDWRSADEPIMWDGPEEEDRYRVGFHCDAPGLYPHRLTAGFAGSSRWQGARSYVGPRRVETNPQFFDSPGDGIVIVDFHVVSPPMIEGVRLSRHG